MSPLMISANKDDLVAYNWDEVLAGAEIKACDYYVTRLFEVADKAKADGDPRAEGVYALLGVVASPMLTPEKKGQPLSPSFVLQGSRSAIPDDIDDTNLEALAGIVDNIADAEMQSRIADILWIRKRNIQMARLAIKSYTRAAETLASSNHASLCSPRLKRALQLALQIKDPALVSDAVACIDNLLDEEAISLNPFLPAELMELLQEHKKGDASRLAAFAERVALEAEQAEEWHRARTYWEVKAEWHKQLKEPEARRNALIRAAETYERDAEDALKRSEPSYLAASAFLEREIEGLKRAGASSERIGQLHTKLLKYQEQAPEEMGTFSTPQVDITKIVQQSRDQVKGKKLLDALFALALVSEPPSVASLRQQVTELASQFRLTHLIPHAIVNEQGKVIARKPAMFSDDPQEFEDAIITSIQEHASYSQQIIVLGAIEPARGQISLEHNVRVQDLLPIVTNNPFVPSGREPIFARGLYAGLLGDFLEALHLLIPQIENSLRYVLYQNQVITSNYDKDGIQNEYPLGKLVCLPEVKQMFGEDFAFDLQTLLVSRFGSNLRNRIAHGLLSYDQFFSLQASYLWWLTLRLCCLPLILRNDEMREGNEETVDEVADEEIRRRES